MRTRLYIRHATSTMPLAFTQEDFLCLWVFTKVLSQSWIFCHLTNEDIILLCDTSFIVTVDKNKLHHLIPWGWLVQGLNLKLDSMSSFSIVYCTFLAGIYLICILATSMLSLMVTILTLRLFHQDVREPVPNLAPNYHSFHGNSYMSRTGKETFQ